MSPRLFSRLLRSQPDKRAAINLYRLDCRLNLFPRRAAMKSIFLMPSCSLMLAFALTFAVAGCGDSPTGGNVALAKAEGVVTFKGGPLAGATVTFIPEKGPVASGVTDLEGKFSLSTGTMPGAALGPCNVTVSAVIPGSGAKSSSPLTEMTKPPTTDEE